MKRFGVLGTRTRERTILICLLVVSSAWALTEYVLHQAAASKGSQILSFSTETAALWFLE